jgi:hypothetical protein
VGGPEVAGVPVARVAREVTRMRKKGRPWDKGRRIVIREGYQGKPMPPGARPPKGPAANVPVKQEPAQK